MATNKRLDTPAMRTFRVLAVLGVFIGAGILFWNNYEKSLNKIKAKQDLWDQTNTLSAKQKEAIYDFAAQIKREFGLDLNIKITREKPLVPQLDGKTIFIGLSPPRQEANIVFPPLTQKAVGKEFVHHLQNEHFREYWPDNWPQGLGDALTKIGKKLSKVGK